MTSPEGEALLAWMNTFPEVQPLNVTNFIDLRDCKGIALLWNAVHPNKINVDALGTPNGPADWLTVLKNVREVEKVTSPVLTEKGLKERVDITKLSRQGSEEELVKFISPLVIIAASSPLKREVIARIKSLSPQNRKVIQTIIQNFAQKKKEANASKSSTTTTAPPPKTAASPPNTTAASTPPTPDTKKVETEQNPPAPLNNDNKPSAPAEVSNTQEAPKTAEEKQPEQSPQSSQQSQSQPQPSQQTEQQPQPSSPSEKVEASQQPQPQTPQAKPEPEPVQSNQPMKTENFELLVREAESQIEQLKKDIESRDAQITQLQEQANKKFKKADQSKAQYIDQTERMIADIIHENEENNEKLEQLRHDDQAAQNNLIAMKARIDALQGVAQKTMADHQKRRDLFNSIKKLEDTITENAYLDSQIQHLQENLKKINSPQNNQKNSNSLLDDENETLSPQQMDEEIEKLKEDITTSIQLAEKYGNSTNESIKPAENENHETVTELAARITQMEIELAVIKDAVQSGHSGVPPDLQKEQKELKKVIKKLMERKEELLNDMKLREQLRLDMRRVQQTMVEQREEVEKELEKQTDDINARNVDLTNWLSFSSSFDTWRRSSTFLTDLRQSYL